MDPINMENDIKSTIEKFDKDLEEFYNQLVPEELQLILAYNEEQVRSMTNENYSAIATSLTTYAIAISKVLNKIQARVMMLNQALIASYAKHHQNYGDGFVKMDVKMASMVAEMEPLQKIHNAKLAYEYRLKSVDGLVNMLDKLADKYKNMRKYQGNF